MAKTGRNAVTNTFACQLNSKFVFSLKIYICIITLSIHPSSYLFKCVSKEINRHQPSSLYTLCACMAQMKQTICLWGKNINMFSWSCSLSPTPCIPLHIFTSWLCDGWQNLNNHALRGSQAWPHSLSTSCQKHSCLFSSVPVTSFRAP